MGHLRVFESYMCWAAIMFACLTVDLGAVCLVSGSNRVGHACVAAAVGAFAATVLFGCDWLLTIALRRFWRHTAIKEESLWL